MRWKMLVVALVGTLSVTGCGEAVLKKKTLELKDVPENVMAVAKEKLPGVTFETAWQLGNGVYEVRGKAKNGKVREIDIKPDGTVVEIE
jgi:hypothetical protein